MRNPFKRSGSRSSISPSTSITSDSSGYFDANPQTPPPDVPDHRSQRAYIRRPPNVYSSAGFSRDHPPLSARSSTTIVDDNILARSNSDTQLHQEKSGGTRRGDISSLAKFSFSGASRPSASSQEKDSVALDPLSPGGDDQRRRGSLALNSISMVRPGLSSVGNYTEKATEKLGIHRERKSRDITHHTETDKARQQFILRLAKALLTFGSPSHRIESQLDLGSKILRLDARFLHFPNLIMVTFLDSDTRISEYRFVRSHGRIALSALHKVHLVYRNVMHDKVGVSYAAEAMTNIIDAPPLYGTTLRCAFAFIGTSIVCALAFGGSLLDMFICGLSASVLQLFSIKVAARGDFSANIFAFIVAVIISLIARVLATIPGQLFCYTAISSGGVAFVLPGFIVLISGLELTSQAVLCGSVRVVYAVFYTSLLGFGLTTGSAIYLIASSPAIHDAKAATALQNYTYHGSIVPYNDTVSVNKYAGNFTWIAAAANATDIRGCYRGDDWPWWRQPFPWWADFFLVPIYSICASLSNLQSPWSLQLPIMVFISCAAYAANKAASVFISSRTDIVAASGAIVVGLCGNVYSRIMRNGTAFTSMVTGVSFLVPSAIGSSGGLIQDSQTLTALGQYNNFIGLGVRMVEVSIGVTVGLLMAQLIVYLFGRPKNAGAFAF